MQPKTTHHARARLRQRGIAPQTLQLLLQFGRRSYDHRGGCVLSLDHAGRERAMQAAGPAAAQLNLNVFAVLDTSMQHVVTVGHRTRRVKENA